MKNFKKTLVALVATIAAVFGMGFGVSAANAVDYGAEVAVSGKVATVTFSGLTPGAEYRVQYDNAVYSNVTLASLVYSNAAKAHQDGTLTATYTFRDGAKAGDQVKATLVDAAGNVVTTATITVPATGAGDNEGTSNGSSEGSTEEGGLAKTGAAIAPYAVAVVLLAAAGIALVDVRKNAARR